MTKYEKNLHPVGELAVDTTGGKKALKQKLENRGATHYFVGYATGHVGDVFRMVNLQSNRVTETRDVTFLGKMYGEIYDTENYIAYLKGGDKIAEKLHIEIDKEVVTKKSPVGNSPGKIDDDDDLSTYEDDDVETELQNLRTGISDDAKKLAKLE